MLDAYPELTVVLARMGGWKQWDEVLAGRGAWSVRQRWAVGGCRRLGLRVASGLRIVSAARRVAWVQCNPEKPGTEVRL